MRRILLLLAPVLWLAQAATAQDMGLPQAQIATSLGTITVALDRARAPATVDNFIRYAREGHFDGTMVYRVVPHFVIQAGSIEASGKSREAHAPIPLESGNGLGNVRGSVAMARGDDTASATAEFFINLKDNSAALDPKPGDPPHTTGFAVFGEVVAGMSVVNKIARTALKGGVGPFPDNDPKTAVVIESVTIAP